MAELARIPTNGAVRPALVDTGVIEPGQEAGPVGLADLVDVGGKTGSELRHWVERTLSCQRPGAKINTWSFVHRLRQ